MFQSSKEKRAERFIYGNQYRNMEKHPSERALQYGSQPPYKYTQLCPDVRYRTPQ